LAQPKGYVVYYILVYNYIIVFNDLIKSNRIQINCFIIHDV